MDAAAIDQLTFEAALAAVEAGEDAPSDEIVPGIRDPFKR